MKNEILRQSGFYLDFFYEEEKMKRRGRGEEKEGRGEGERQEEEEREKDKRKRRGGAAEYRRVKRGNKRK